MSKTKFLSDKIFHIVCYAAAALFTAVFLPLQKVDLYAVFFLEMVGFLAFSVPLFLEYIKKRTYYAEALELLYQLDKKYLIFEMMEEPGFNEGRILYEFLYHTSKSMNDKIAFHRQESEDYQEYIELWIHEVKTPLASCKLLLDNHRSEMSDEMEKELEQIDHYLEQVLYFARSKSAKEDYIVRRVSLEKLVKDTLRQQSKQFIRHKVQPVLGELDFDVYTDVKWTGYMIRQILGNAVKYKHDPAKVEIHALEENGNVILKIQDNGIGISQQDLARVFDRGFTGKTGRLYGKSTGMGLYLCRRLGERLQIPIGIESEEGTGTCVTLTFTKDQRIELLTMNVLQNECNDHC